MKTQINEATQKRIADQQTILSLQQELQMVKKEKMFLADKLDRSTVVSEVDEKQKLLEMERARADAAEK